MATRRYSVGSDDSQLPLEPSPEVVALLVTGFIRRGDQVLDLGCFQGDDVVYLQTAGCIVKGIDVSPTAVAYADGLANLWKNVAGRPTFSRGQAPGCLRRLPKEHFDVVLDRLLYSNLEEEEQIEYLRQVWRVLKPSGIFVIRSGLDVVRPLDGAKRRPVDARDVRAGGFRAVRWQRPGVHERDRYSRGAEMWLSPIRAGFHREAWFEVFEKKIDRDT